MLQVDEAKLNTILADIKEGSMPAFEEFFYHYQPSVYRFIYRYTGEKESAEDLTQDTFIKFWQFRANIDLNSSPVALLYRIARNSSLNYVTRRPHTESYIDNEDILVSICRNPEKEYEQAFLMDDFQKAINMLPERCRAIFVLSRYSDMPYAEIADVLQISLQTVKNQMNKAISILKKRLSSHLD